MSRYVSNITIEYYFTRYNLHTYARLVSPASNGSKFKACSPKSSMYAFLASKRLCPRISLKRRVKSASCECDDKCTRLVSTYIKTIKDDWLILD